MPLCIRGGVSLTYPIVLLLSAERHPGELGIMLNSCRHCKYFALARVNIKRRISIQTNSVCCVQSRAQKIDPCILVALILQPTFDTPYFTTMLPYEQWHSWGYRDLGSRMRTGQSYKQHFYTKRYKM